MKKALITLFLTSSISVGFTQVDLETGLVGSYEFDGDANTSVGSINGTVSGAVLTADRFGNENSAYLFDGKDDYINLSDDEAFAFEDNYSFALWARKDGLGSGSNTSSLPNSGILFNREGEYELGVKGDGRVIYATSTTQVNGWAWENTTEDEGLVNDSAWYFYVFTFQNGVTSIYINGDLVGSQDLGGTIDEASSLTDSYDELWLGGREFYPDAQNFNGAIDDVKIYDKVLSNDEIEALFNAEDPNITSLNDAEDISLVIAPNPSADYVNIEVEGMQLIELRDLNGFLIKSQFINTNQTQVDLSEMETGVYIMTVVTENNSYQKRIQVNK